MLKLIEYHKALVKAISQGLFMNHQENIEAFFNTFIPAIKNKSEQVHRTIWLLATTGLEDLAKLLASLSSELKILYSDTTVYQALLKHDQDPNITNPLVKRALNILIRLFKENMLPEELLTEIAQKEAGLSQTYGTFRPMIDKQAVGENDILNILKNETDVSKRKTAWEASKKIGSHLADQILDLVKLRNTAAHRLGYSDFYSMQLQLQEVDKKWMLATLEKLIEDSSNAHRAALDEIEIGLQQRFNVDKNALGPWAWNDPFCQEDPLALNFDELLQDVDTVKASQDFYQSMNVNVNELIEKSDLFERDNKNQHAFCLHVDRYEDVKILCNMRPSFRWLETLLHELGHGIYDLGYDNSLPWVLRDPPHMITTEAMALIAGRQAYNSQFLKAILNDQPDLEQKLEQIKQSQIRRQLLFSRWVLVMVHFEIHLYSNPEQDLNALWWSLVQKYQKICPPGNRSNCHDWAAKYHVGLAPVYYHSYLLGEMFASMLQENFLEIANTSSMYGQPKIADFLKEKLFRPGARFSWDKLIKHSSQKNLNDSAWIKEFATTAAIPS